MLKIINRLYDYKCFPISLRVLTFIAFIFLILIGFTSPSKDPFFISMLSKTNLTTSFIWRLWWPLVVLSAVFLGRVWCMICPMEMVTRFFAKIGFKFRRPGWVLSGWVIPVFYMVILIFGVTLLQIDQNTKYTSWYLLGIMGVAVLTGIVFGKNTFCRYVCPIGYMLGLISKLAMWGWRVQKKSVCKECRDKSCINHKYIYQFNNNSCGIDLIPAEIETNNYCILCGGCRKSCKTYQIAPLPERPNPSLVKIGFAHDLMQVIPLKPSEVFFLFLMTGSMMFELTHYTFLSDLSSSIFPQKLSVMVGTNFEAFNQLIMVGWFFFLFPLIVWILPYFLMKSVGVNISAVDYVRKISLAFIPVIALFFVGLSLMEIVTKLPYYPLIIQDIRGIETVKSLIFKQIEIPNLPYWTDVFFFVLLLFLMFTGIYYGFKVIRKIYSLKSKQPSGMLAFSLPFLFMILILVGSFLFLSF